ncbi:unnamed protein product [Lampetra fluviatilis]
MGIENRWNIPQFMAQNWHENQGTSHVLVAALQSRGVGMLVTCCATGADIPQNVPAIPPQGCAHHHHHHHHTTPTRDGLNNRSQQLQDGSAPRDISEPAKSPVHSAAICGDTRLGSVTSLSCLGGGRREAWNRTRHERSTARARCGCGRSSEVQQLAG